MYQHELLAHECREQNCNFAFDTLQAYIKKAVEEMSQGAADAHFVKIHSQKPGSGQILN